jgi:glycosyltransferase involved in cell wall biosynthesis
MRVTIVDEELPYPAVTGKRIRILNLALNLAKRHEITFLCHRNSDSDEAQKAESFLNQHGINTILVDRPNALGDGAQRTPKLIGRIVSNLFSSVPYSVQWNDCPRLRDAVERHAAKNTIDLWQCEWAPYATALAPLRGARSIMMAHDIQSLIWERYYRSTSNPLKRLLIKQQWLRYRRYEERVFSAASLTITVTDADAQRAQDLGARRTAVVDNGVDISFYQSFQDQQRVQRRPNEILFLGNLEWRANIDAVCQLLDSIFPKVLAEEPTARLCIVGRRPPKWLRQRAEHARNVEIHAVRPYLYRCGALAVPLRIGGGSRLKILEALACGLPVVSTTVGAEGLRLDPDTHLAKAENSQEMAETLVNWIRDPEPALALARAGRQVVETHYDWAALADRMEQAWDGLLNGSESLARVEGV